MRIRQLYALLIVGILLTMLAGCSNGNNTVTQKFGISGRVVDTNGAANINTPVTLSKGGVVLGTTNTNTVGNFAFASQTSNYFVVDVAASDRNVRTIFGPFFLPTSGPITIVAPTQNQLPDTPTTPVNDTATLIVEAFNPNGVQVSQFSVKVGTMATVSSVVNNPAFAVVKNIPTTSPPTGTDIVLTNLANGGTATVKGVKFTANTVVLLQGVIPNGNTVNTFTAAGTVINSVTQASIPNLKVAIRELSNFTTTSSGIGAFSFTQVPAGVFNLQGSSNAASGVASVFPAFGGPFSGTSTAVALPKLLAFTQADLPNVVPGGITIPFNNTATLVVYAERANALIGLATVKVQGRTATSTTPVVITDLAPTNGSDIEVSTTSPVGDVILRNIPLPQNTITVVTAFIP